MQFQITVHGDLDIEQQPLPTERLAQGRAPDDGEDLRTEPGQPQLHTRLALALLRFREHLERGVLEVEHIAQVEHDNLRLRGADERTDALRDPLGIEKEQPAAQAQQQQAGERLVLRMLARARAEDFRTGLAAEHVHRRISRLLSERDDRDDDRYEDALERAEQHDAAHCGQRPHELGAADAQHVAEIGRA